ncbi:Methyl-accepting chemotaxis protein McpB [compost metagenome]
MITTKQMAAQSNKTYSQNVQPIYLITEIRGNNRAIESFLLEFLITKDDAKNQELIAAIGKSINTNNELIAQLKAISFSNKEVSGKINEYLSLLPDYRVQRDSVVHLAGKKLKNEGYQIFSGSSFSESRKLMVSLLDDTAGLLVQDAQEHNGTSQQNAKSFMTLSIVLVIAALLLGLGAGFIISSMIANPLKELQALMKRAETGDLTAEAAYQSRDEIGQINSSFNAMLSSLMTMMQGIVESTEMLSASSQEMSASTEQTARASQIIAETSGGTAAGFDVQVETIDRAAHSVQAMAEAIAAVERSSHEMSGLMAEAAMSTGRGADAVEIILAQMKELHSSVFFSQERVSSLGSLSEEINIIITTIQDSIRAAAQQTEEIREAVGHVSLEALTVSQAMKQASEVSRKSAEEVQANSAASEELLTAMGEMSMSAQYLASLAGNLQVNLARFKLS